MYVAQSQHVAGVFETCRKKCCTADVCWDGSWRADVKQLSVCQSVSLCVQWWRDQLWVEQTQLIPALPVCEDSQLDFLVDGEKQGFSLAHIWFSFMTATLKHVCVNVVCSLHVPHIFTAVRTNEGPAFPGVLLDGKNHVTNVTEQKWQFN